MTTYRTTKANGRLTKTEKVVGKFKVQTYLESGEFNWIAFRVINADGEQVHEVLEGTDPEFDEAVKVGTEMAKEETANRSEA